MQSEQRLAGTERGLEDIEQSAKAKVMVPFFQTDRVRTFLQLYTQNSTVLALKS